MSANPDPSTDAHTPAIDTGGGTYVAGHLETGGDFIGRDQIIQIAIVHGHKVENIPPAALALLAATTRFLWWVITLLATTTSGLWIYLWWRWQSVTPAKLEPWLVAVAALVTLATGLLVWLHTQTTAPGGSSILAGMFSPVLDSIVQHWRGLFYRQQYLANLTARVRYYDTQDLTIQSPVALDAEQVYVEPHLKVSPLHTISPAVLAADDREIDERCHPIWHFLRQAPPRGAVGPRPLVLLAGPGYGKSALLRHIVQIVSGDRRTRQRYLAPEKLPLLLFLRDQIAQIVTISPVTSDAPTHDHGHDYTLPQALADRIQRQTGASPPRHWLEYHLRKGNCVVLLDGLDEIADPTQQEQMVAWINQQRHNFQRNQFILTSRPLAYQGKQVAGATTVEIMPLATDQIQDFIRRWYRAEALASTTEANKFIEHAAAQQAQQLIQRIAQSPALTRLAQNPLLLTMILHVHKHKGDALPEKRITLLAEAFWVLLKRRPDPNNLSPEQKQVALLPLAYALQQRRVAEIELQAAVQIVTPALQDTPVSNRAEEWLAGIRRDSGLLLIENQKLLFAHLLFQSYLSAHYVTKTQWLNDLLTNLDDSWWRETILLYCALNDATPVVQACLAADTFSSLRFRLAIDCLNEADRMNPAALDQIAHIVRTGLENKEARDILKKALTEIRQERELRLSETKYVDAGLITNVEYQLFLFDRYDHDHFHQPDHWLDLQFTADQAISPVVGVRAQDALAFCAWLNEQEPTNTWRFRLPHRTEVAEEGVLAALKVPLLNFWMLDEQPQPVCPRPPRMPALALDAIQRQLVDDVQRPHAYAPATLFGVNTNPLSPSEAVALLSPYDFDRSQLASHITQMRHSLTLAIQNANRLANSLHAASQEFQHRADEYRALLDELDRSLRDQQHNLQTLEARRDAEIQAIAKHCQQQYAEIDEHIEQQQVAEKALKQPQESEHSRITQAYEALYTKIADEIQRINALIENNNAITAKNHAIIHQNYQQRYEQLDQTLRNAQSVDSKNQTIHENNLRIIQAAISHRDTLIAGLQREIEDLEAMDKTQYDVSAAVAGRESEISSLEGERKQISGEERAEADAANDIFKQNRKVIADIQQQRNQLEAEEKGEHTQEDRENQQHNAENEAVIADYQNQLRRRQDEEKQQHATIDGQVDEQKKQLLALIRHAENEREGLRSAERQQSNTIKHNYAPFLQDAESTVNRLTRERNEITKAEATARQRAARCEEFPNAIVHPLTIARSSLDDFDHAAQAFFSDASAVAVAVEKALSQAIKDAGELTTFLQEISSGAATPVTHYQQDIETIRQTFLTAKAIINRRDTVAAMLESVCGRVENSDLQPLADSNPLERINRHLRTTVDDIQRMIEHSNRKLNLQSAPESAHQRLAYMRLILLTGALCLLNTPKLDRIHTTLLESLLEQYVKLIMIEDRMRSATPAYEGLRLIKEYVATKPAQPVQRR